LVQFILFNALGFTINTLTFIRFVLAIGIVVDDAIIVVEAVATIILNSEVKCSVARWKSHANADERGGYNQGGPV